MGLRQHLYIVNGHCSSTKGSSLLEPLTVRHGPLSVFMFDKQLLWKLLDVMETGQHAGNVIKSRSDGMSKLCLPRLETTLMPSALEPVVLLQAQFSPLYPCPLNVPWDTYATRQCGVNVVSRHSCRIEGSHLPEPLPVDLHCPPVFSSYCLLITNHIYSYSQIHH